LAFEELDQFFGLFRHVPTSRSRSSDAGDVTRAADGSDASQGAPEVEPHPLRGNVRDRSGVVGRRPDRRTPADGRAPA
jgi:hypothetical protein